MSVKLDLGSATEDDIQRFVEHSFGVDFVYRSPSHLKGGKEKETTDVLSVFEDVTVPIEVKSQAYNVDGSARKPDRRWTKKNLKKAATQITGAVRTLRSQKAVTLQNIRRGTLVFDKARTKYFYGVIILNHVDTAFRPEEVVPRIQEAGFPVHVFSFVDFYNVVRVLDTPGDLIGYLEMRADVLIPTLYPRVHEEKAVLAYYLDNLEELMVFRARLKGDTLSKEAVRPYAEALRQIANRTFADLRESYYIDIIIDKAHEVDNSLPIPMGAIRSDYAVIAEHLSRLVRPRRGYLGKQFWNAVERAEQSDDIAYAHASSRRRDECILFVVSPQKERGKRIEELQQHLELLRTTRGVRRGLGIATEAGHSSGRSYDFILAEGDPEAGWPPEALSKIKVLGETMFGSVESR